MIDSLISTLESWKIYLEGLKYVDHWQSVVQLFLLIVILGLPEIIVQRSDR